jgi:hypothetical protein
MTYRTFSHRRALIAQRLGIPVAEVTVDEVLSYDAGEMEVAEACDWPRLPQPSISSGPYYTHPIAGVVPAYTVWPVPGGAFPDDEQWPSPLPSLLTDGSGGE